MPGRKYSHRSVVDKMGIKPGHTVAIDEGAWAIDGNLRRDVLARTGQAGEAEAADTVLVTADATTDVVAHLLYWKDRIHPAGGIWVLTPKRGLPGYVPQEALIPLGLEAGLVDNKICSVSETVSAMRFVIRRRDRPYSTMQK